jgi:hypothetical protein
MITSHDASTSQNIPGNAKDESLILPSSPSFP